MCGIVYLFVFCVFGLIHFSAFFDSEGHVALDRNPGTGYDTLLLRMIPRDLLSDIPIDSSTHYPAFWTVGLHCQTPHCVPCREAVCTIFMMFFGMTRPGGELTTYRTRGGHATDRANPTRFCVFVIYAFLVLSIQNNTLSLKFNSHLLSVKRRTNAFHINMAAFHALHSRL